MKTTHRLIQGDSRNLSRIKDKSVHLIITSPPYWQLKDYGNDGQIGFHDSYETLSFGETEYSFEQDDARFDIDDKMRALPCMFNDPHKMDSKIDIKKLQFGSKIDKNSKEREEYFSVKTILSPNTVMLNNGLTVRLLGIKEKPSVNGNATKFLMEKTKGRKVFLRYDSVKYDDHNMLLCYLYLDNKTFINAHLLKNGLADVDYSFDFKYKNKFEKLINV